MMKFFAKYLAPALIICLLCYCDSNNVEPFTKVEMPICEQISIKSVKYGDFDLFTFDALNNLISHDYPRDSSQYIYSMDKLVSINKKKQYHIKYNSLNMVSEVYVYDKHGKTGTSYSFAYDNNRRLSKWICTKNNYKNGYLYYGNIETTKTTVIKYDKDGNVLNVETEMSEKNFDRPNATTIERNRVEYSQYDNHTNAFKFLVNTFHLALILDYRGYYRFPDSFWFSKNNPQVEKRFYWSKDNMYKPDRIYNYTYEYDGDLVTRFYKKNDSGGIMENLSFEYKCNK